MVENEMGIIVMAKQEKNSLLIETKSTLGSVGSSPLFWKSLKSVLETILRTSHVLREQSRAENFLGN